MRRTISNPELVETIRFLKVKARENKSRLWEVAAEDLSKPHRSRAVLDLNHISRASVAELAVLVPGKVLGSGSLRHPVIIGAFEFSQSAKSKIQRAGGECIGIKDFVSRYPKGSKVQIMR
jgi:large subunit ribosomal protein L18e